jgi:hypothetical protein
MRETTARRPVPQSRYGSGMWGGIWAACNLALLIAPALVIF